jgi:hypothetical protein
MLFAFARKLHVKLSEAELLLIYAPLSLKRFNEIIDRGGLGGILVVAPSSSESRKSYRKPALALQAISSRRMRRTDCYLISKNLYHFHWLKPYISFNIGDYLGTS